MAIQRGQNIKAENGNGSVLIGTAHVISSGAVASIMVGAVLYNVEGWNITPQLPTWDYAVVAPPADRRDKTVYILEPEANDGHPAWFDVQAGESVIDEYVMGAIMGEGYTIAFFGVEQ